MPTPYEPPPEKHPERVPSNRSDPKKGWMIWIAVLLCAVVYNVFRPPDRPSRVARPAPTASTAPDAPLWPAAIPVGVAALLSLAFARTRSRLPAKYRTGELQLVKAEPPPVVEPPPPAPMTPIEMKGRGQNRPVVLRVDDDGFHWHATEQLLRKGQWLDIGWDELRALDVNGGDAGAAKVGLWLVLVLVFTGLYQAFKPGQPVDKFAVGFSLVCAVIGVGLLLIGRLFSSGVMTITTRTHALKFMSRQLRRDNQEVILSAFKARRPELVPPSRGDGWKGLYILLLGPLVEARYLLMSDAAVESWVRAQATEPLDEETVLATALQQKLSRLWMAGFCSFIPLSVGVAAVVSTRLATSFAWGFGAAWAVGLVASVGLQSVLARLIGMKLFIR